ncbi:hypothetical protein WA026_001462 [Henosepilachna vigintioctopunctata]|uniref:Uncharacterized protein n=1 Tax=Henosepilachna vigintioctopunctata TaxID=420089 RepID=A0AAW1URX4_9CUCU
MSLCVNIGFVFNVQLAASRIDQRASCAGLEGAGRTARKPPPLLRSRTLPAIVVPGVNILKAQLGNTKQENTTSPDTRPNKVSALSRFHPARISLSKDDSVTLDVRRKSAISRLCGNGNYGPERGADGGVILRVPAPHVVAARAYRITSPGGGNNALFKLGRLLNNQNSGDKNQMRVEEANVTRRLSWERRDTLNTRLPRSSSIDSMVEAVWAETVTVSPLELPIPPVQEKRMSLRPDRPLALVSPSVGRRMKGQRGINAHEIYNILGSNLQPISPKI